MIQFTVDYRRCLREKGIDCRNCVKNCVMKILGIKNNRVTMLKPENCILCHNCVGACMVDLTVIDVRDMETSGGDDGRLARKTG